MVKYFLGTFCYIIWEDYEWWYLLTSSLAKRSWYVPPTKMIQHLPWEDDLLSVKDISDELWFYLQSMQHYGRRIRRPYSIHIIIRFEIIFVLWNRIAKKNNFIQKVVSLHPPFSGRKILPRNFIFGQFVDCNIPLPPLRVEFYKN